MQFGFILVSCNLKGKVIFSSGFGFDLPL